MRIVHVGVRRSGRYALGATGSTGAVGVRREANSTAGRPAGATKATRRFSIPSA
jgi:hypothetical protein